MPINVKNKAFLLDYVTTAQLEAGEYLKLKNPDPVVLNTAKQSSLIQSRPVILNYTDNSWNFGPRTVHHYHAPAVIQVRQTEREKKEAKEQLAKVIGSIISIAGAFLVGVLYTSFSRYNTTYTNTLAVEKKFDKAFAKHTPGPTFPRDEISELITTQLSIDRLNVTRVRNYGFAAAALLVGGASMAIGGFAAIPAFIVAGQITTVASAFIVAGQITTVASAAFAALNCGLHWNDAEDIRKSYQKIVGKNAGNYVVPGLADTILQRLYPLENNLGEPSVAYSVKPQEYAPLYPDLYASAPAWDE